MRRWLLCLLCLAPLAAQEGFTPKPTAHHLAMKAQAGTWKAVATMFMGPGKPPLVSTGVEVNTLVSSGLWLQSEMKAEMMGQPFEGHGLFGYDTLQKAHVGVWVDNGGTWMAVSRGTCEGDCKVMTLFFEGYDEQGRPVTFKEVHTQLDADHRSMEMLTRRPDGTFVKMMEMTYTRMK